MNLAIFRGYFFQSYHRNEIIHLICVIWPTQLLKAIYRKIKLVLIEMASSGNVFEIC